MEHRSEAYELIMGFACANSKTKLPILKRQTLLVTGIYFDASSSNKTSNSEITNKGTGRFVPVLNYHIMKTHEE
jgi:hypothetical protein